MVRGQSKHERYPDRSSELTDPDQLNPGVHFRGSGAERSEDILDSARGVNDGCTSALEGVPPRCIEHLAGTVDTNAQQSDMWAPFKSREALEWRLQFGTFDVLSGSGSERNFDEIEGWVHLAVEEWSRQKRGLITRHGLIESFV